MMAYSEDHIALAAEYALGTLDADERAQAEAMMSVDKDFAAMVEAWSTKLGALNQMVGSVEPSPEVWEKIKAAAGLSGAQMPLVLPEAPPPAVEPAVVETAAVPEPSNVVAFPAPGPALAQYRHRHDRDRGRLDRDRRDPGGSAGSAARQHSPDAADASGAGPGAAGSGAGAICRRAAEGRRLARIHSHRRWRDAEFHGAQGRCRRPSRARAMSCG